MKNQQLTINVPGDIIKEIEKYKKSKHRRTTEAAITALIKFYLYIFEIMIGTRQKLRLIKRLLLEKRNRLIRLKT